MNQLPCNRRATHADIDGIMTICSEAFEEMNFSRFGQLFEYDHIKNIWIKSLDGKQFISYCNDNQTCALLLMLLDSSPYYSKGPLTAHEICYHALPSLNAITKTRMMQSILDYGIHDLKCHGVKHLHMNTAPQFESVEKIFKKHNSQVMSVIHHMEI